MIIIKRKQYQMLDNIRKFKVKSRISFLNRKRNLDIKNSENILRMFERKTEI